MYQVPQHIDDNRIFIVQRSEIEGRLDAQYYKMSIHIPNSVKLSSFASVKGGKRIPKGYSYSEEQTPYYYLRVADMDNDNELSFESLKFIDEEVFNKLKRYEIKKNELAISIAGTIGKICYLSDIPEGCRIILTENCAKVVILDENVLTVRYLEVLFKMPFIQKQLKRNYIQTTIPKLGLDKIASLNFPQIPTLEFQKQVVDYYTLAYKQKIQKESEAQKLLDSIDAYILNELGITLPEIKTDLKSRMFLVNRSELEERLDPTVYKDGTKLISSLFENVKLSNVAFVNPGGAYKGKPIGTSISFIPMEVIDEVYSEISSQGETTIADSSGFTKFKEGDLLWAKITPCMQNGKSAIARDLTNGLGCGSTEFFVLRPKDERLSVEYLHVILHLKCVRETAMLYFGGSAGQQRVSASFLEKFNLPLPSLTKQQEIANHIYAIRQQAKQLQEEGKTILENAKKEVEQMIIG